MAAEFGTPAEAKKALTTKPKWSFGSVRYWPSKLKPKHKITFKQNSMPKIVRVTTSKKSKLPTFISLPFHIIFTAIIFGFALLFCVPILLYGVFKSIQANRHPKPTYRIKRDNL